MKEMDFWQIYDYRAVFIFWIIAIEIDEKFVFLSLHFAAVCLRLALLSVLENSLLPFWNNSPHTHSDWVLAALSRRLSSSAGQEERMFWPSFRLYFLIIFRPCRFLFANISETLEGSVRYSCSWFLGVETYPPILPRNEILTSRDSPLFQLYNLLRGKICHCVLILHLMRFCQILLCIPGTNANKSLEQYFHQLPNL